MGKTYKCEKCLKTFSQKSHYDKHMKKKNDCEPIANELKKLAQEVYDENKAKDLVKRLNHLFENFQKICDIHEPNFGSQGYKLKEGKCQEQMIQILDFLKNLKNLDEKRYDSLYNDKEWNLFIMAYGDISLKKHECYYDTDEDNEQIKIKIEDDDTEYNWKLLNDNRINMEEKNDTRYDELKANIDAIIRACHNVLYSNGAIVGKKAMNDIMKLFTVKLLQPLFNDKNSNIYKKWDSYKNDNKITGRKASRYQYCEDLLNLAKTDNPLNEWKMLVNGILLKILPNLFDAKDTIFNCNEDALLMLIQHINKLDNVFWNHTEDAQMYDTISGDVYEYFINGYLNGGGKELGQFFTPRKLINLIIYGLDVMDYVQDFEDIDIFDPCMGSGGFLTRFYNEMDNIRPENIYGNEIEKDTIKFGFSNLLLNTSIFSKNIKCQDSLINIDHQKHMVIPTNPPFGTKMSYQKDKKVKKGLKEKYEEAEAKKLKTDPEYKTVPFKEIFPIKTNNGACLFTQLCVYKLKTKGMCCIVLPDGQLFFGKNFAKFRKWLCENVRIKNIVKIPSGTFEHTGIKTCVIKFIKGKKTKSIRFLETDETCGELKKIIKISTKDLEENNYSFDPKDYIEDEYIANLKGGSSCKWITIGDICNVKTGSHSIRKDEFKNKTEGYLVIGGGTKSIGRYKESNCDANTIICATHGTVGHISMYPEKTFMTMSLSIKPFDKSINNKFLYYYLKYFNDLLKGRESCGVSLITVSKVKKVNLPKFSLEIQEKIVKELDWIESQKNKIKDLKISTKEEMEIYRKYGLEAELKREFIKNCKWDEFGKYWEYFKTGNSHKKGKVFNKEGHAHYGSNGPIGYLDEYTFDGEYILLGRTGSCGKVKIVNEKFSAGDTVFVIKIKDCNIELIYYYLKYLLAQTDISKGSTIGVINKTKLNKFKFPIPKTLEHQQKLISIYKNKEKKLQDYENEIKHLENRIEDLNELGKQIIEANI